MQRNRIIAEVPTSDLQSGDIVVWNDGSVVRFLKWEEIADSEYVTLFWGEREASAWTSTAQPWNEWPAVIRLVQS